MDAVRLVDKPAGKTSHDIVAAVRRQLPRGVRVGHAGTLDPFATGLLLVLTGRATRTQQYLLGLDKTYQTVARLGWTSTTGDPEGELEHTGRVPDLSRPLPTGLLRQRPPAHSAVHVDGERAYARARRGEVVDVPEREVRVDRFEVLAQDGDTARLAIDCSSGTYVRSLVADLGDAYCLELRRTAIGPFGLEEEGHQLALAEALGRVMPLLRVEGDLARRAGFGQRVELDLGAPRVLLVDEAGPIGVAEPQDDGLARIVVGFR